MKNDNWNISVKKSRIEIGVVFSILIILVCTLNNALKAGIIFGLLFLLTSFVNISGEIKKFSWKITYMIVLFGISAFMTVFLVRTPWMRSNWCKAQTYPDNGKRIAEQQECLS